jgi:hypothetical protein
VDWKQVKVPAGTKLFKAHSFTFMIKGDSWQLEVDEFSDGTFTGHGEHSTDRNSFIESVSGQTLKECLEGLISRIQSRGT